MAYDRFKFATNVPVEVEFKWDDGLLWQHEQYGISYTFNVAAKWEDREGKHDEDVQIRATPFLLDKLLQAGAGKGSVLTIEKVDGDSGKTDWLVAPTTAPHSAGFWLKNRDRQTVDKLGNPISNKEGGDVVAESAVIKKTGTNVVDAEAEIDKLIVTFAKIHDKVCEDVYGVDPTKFEVRMEDVRSVAVHISIAAQQRNLYLAQPVHTDDSGFDPEHDLDFK